MKHKEFYTHKIKCKTTARLFQTGMSKECAVFRGAIPEYWDELDGIYDCQSIPANVLSGTEYKPPYTCEYHSGGRMSEALLNTIR